MDFLVAFLFFACKIERYFMLKYFSSFIFSLLLCLGSISWADIYIGSGYSAVTAGRQVPMLYAGIDVGNWEITSSATGVKSSLYYHSAYTLSAYSMRNTGNFLWGPLRTGLGFGAFYSKQGYRQTETSTLETADDFTAGPAFRVGWNFLANAFVSIDCMFGLRAPFNLIGLSAQEIPQVVVGVNF